LNYTLPNDVDFSNVVKEIDESITKEIARNKSFSISLSNSKDKTILD